MKINDKNLLEPSDSEKITKLNTPKNKAKFAKDYPDTIIIHYTAGRDAESSAKFLCRDDIKASAHVVVGRAGEIYQLVPFDTIAWHAGKSSYKGRSGFNQYSIGIEIDNAGILAKKGDKYLSWFKKAYPEDEVIQAVHRNESKPRYWHDYTCEQIETVEELCRMLIQKYGIKEILGHEEISPGRKQDPGPAFPLDKLRDRLLRGARDEDEPNNCGVVTASLLNIRQAPTIYSNKVSKALPKNTSVKILDEKEDWYYVEAGPVRGWVYGKYIDIV